MVLPSFVLSLAMLRTHGRCSAWLPLKRCHDQRPSSARCWQQCSSTLSECCQAVCVRRVFRTKTQGCHPHLSRIGVAGATGWFREPRKGKGSACLLHMMECCSCELHVPRNAVPQWEGACVRFIIWNSCSCELHMRCSLVCEDL